MTGNITVLGAGIVGVCCAAYLQREGYRVTLIDRGPPGRGTSFGNAGILSPASCVPMAVPGVVSKLPGWLMDPLGPVAVRFAHLPSMLPWFLHFRKAARIQNVEANADALRRLVAQTFDAYAPLVKAANVPDIVQRPGYVVVYESEAQFEADALAWRIRRERGVEFDVLDGAGIRKLEPALAPIYPRGVYILDQGYVTSPLRLTQSIAAQFQRDGGRIEQREVRDIDVGDRGPVALSTDAGDIPIETLIVAAGVHSARFAAKLGERVLLEAERGYHVEFGNPGVAVTRPINAAAGKFFVTPMETGLRVAGTTEFAGLDRPANPRRARVLLEHAKRMFPDLKTEAMSEWMGQRPSTPDYLPIISASSRFRNVFYAFGHGHLGVVSGAPTGRLVADLVAGRSPAIDVRPYRVDRF
ncbi:MAG: FAD-dependent oxidoreductase [Betaproteobacteria bacterium]|nr:MAG: FAD-dependent oxidoreductase [Betaproteobacteria bacterium]